MQHALAGNFIIEDLIYMPTGNYMPVYNHPYMVNPSGIDIDNLRNKIEENNIGKITPEVVSGFTSSFLQPSAVGYSTVVNENWVSNKKFIFILKVMQMNAIGTCSRFYIQGFTNYDGISNMGSADPDLEHTINSIIETAIYNYNTPSGVVTEEKLVKIYNVITNSIEFVNDIYTQRPTDLLANIQTNDQMNNIFNRDQSFGSIENKQFQLNSFDTRSISSTIDNNIPTRYLSAILNAGIQGNTEGDFNIMDSFSSPVYSGMNKIFEPSLNDCQFIHRLSMAEGFKTAINKFRYKSLFHIDPTIDSRFKLLHITKDYVDPTMLQTPEVGEYWHGQDIVTLKAYSLIEASVSLALRYGFNKLYFSVSNMMDVTNRPTIIVSYFNSFLQLKDYDFTRLLSLFETNYLNEIFLDEVTGMNIPIHIDMYVDILGTSKINLSYCGSQATWYTIPTFANSNFIPIVTTNKTAFDDMSYNMDNAINMLTPNAKRFESPSFY